MEFNTRNEKKIVINPYPAKIKSDWPFPQEKSQASLLIHTVLLQVLIFTFLKMTMDSS